jgi:glycosyltransferase involved in cell wall biosynthesis
MIDFSSAWMHHFPAQDRARPRVAVFFHRFGPYHLARLEAVACHLHLEGVEVSATDKTYAWASSDGRQSFPCHLISSDIDKEPTSQLIARIDQLLAALRPDAVAVHGWSHRSALAALEWCTRSQTAAVLMSESTAWDEIRRPWKEAVKRRVVSLFGSALVGGSPHRDYLAQLGMPDEKIFQGYDVIDNDYFSVHANKTKCSAADERKRFGLPANYFLASARFVEKKNLFRLLEAFELYRGGSGAEAWDLVLLGDGHLRASLQDRVAQRGIAGFVHMPGFKQYEDLPAYYGLAGAFVHASTTEQWGLVVNEAMAASLPVLVSNRCGCAADLVATGRNGYTFDPLRPSELADLMLHVSSDQCDRRRMAEASRAIIGQWTPLRFASSLCQAVDTALAGPPPKAALPDRLLLHALMYRS